ncbi:MAG: hypothetical protein VX617_02845 [Pseudomonadota bacterium]|nr:hypothetical protein [Pseudomonadota bacterium]
MKAGNKGATESHVNTSSKTSKDSAENAAKVSKNTKSVSENTKPTEVYEEAVDLKGEDQRDRNKNAKAKEAGTTNDIETKGDKIKENLDDAPNTGTNKNNANPPNVIIIGDNSGESEPPKRGWWQKLVE